MPTTRPQPVRTPPPGPDALLRDLVLNADRLDKLEASRAALIASARAAGLSWDQISRAVRINRETLRRKFGEPDDPSRQ